MSDLIDIDISHIDTHPNPDDTDPTSFDRCKLREAPVTVRGNDRRDKLSEAECSHESERWTLHEEPTVRTRDEDERLRNDSYLQIDDGVQFRIVVVASSGSSAVTEMNTELAVEPICSDADGDEGNPEKKGQTLVKLQREIAGQTYVESVR